MSIFDTTAPTDFNTFNQPYNALNQGAPGWGMDRNYLTPAFDAPYRPPYTGHARYIINQSPGFFRSVYGVSPFDPGLPYSVNNQEQDSQYFSQVYNRAQDFGMSMAQRVAVPVAAFAGVTALAKAWQFKPGIGPEFAGPRILNEFFGGTRFATVSGFTNMGARFGGGAVGGALQGVFGKGVLSAAGFGGMAARGAVGVGGALGAAAFGVGVPLALAQGAITAADKMVFDPYIASRESANLFRQRFSGITFAGGGDPYTGQGISRAKAATMGEEMAKYGMKDQVFNAREMATMTDMASQMGMLDNVSSEQLTTKMQAIIRQVKTVMAVVGSTDFKEVMQMMAKLQMAGVTSSNLGGVFAQIGAQSAVAGINPGRMFNTVGAQGQYLFQANGLTPYVGQLTAANQMAGYSSAFRSGLISQDLMARFGGVEGATQLGVTGLVNAAQTPYNMMRAYNKYIGRRQGSDVVGTVSAFNENFAQDPLEAAGRLNSLGKTALSAQMKDDPLFAYQQMMDIADMLPGKRGQKLGWGTMHRIATSLGMDNDQANAYLTQLHNMTDPRRLELVNAAYRSNNILRERQFREQTEQTWFQNLAPVKGAKSLYRGVRSDVTGMFGSFNEFGGGLTDRWQAYANRFLYGEPSSMQEVTVGEATSGPMSLPEVGVENNLLGRSLRRSGVGVVGAMIAATGMLDPRSSDIEGLKRQAKEGNKNAVKFFESVKAGNNEQARAALNQLQNKDQTTFKSTKVSDLNDFIENVRSRQWKDEKTNTTFESVGKDLMDTPWLQGGVLRRMEGLERARALQKEIEDKGEGILSDIDENGVAKNAAVRAFGNVTGIINDPERTKKALHDIYTTKEEKGLSMNSGVVAAGGAQAIMKRFPGMTEQQALEAFMKEDPTRTLRDVTSPFIQGPSKDKLSFTDEKNKSTAELSRGIEARYAAKDLKDKDTQMIMRLLKDGRVDLASGYQMLNAGASLKEAASDLKDAAKSLSSIGKKDVSVTNDDGRGALARAWGLGTQAVSGVINAISGPDKK